ncbi:hypothetical protein SAMN05445504_3153 [Burkholderia sp. CF099]|jgi:hypothetical protein|nr:hypothetical protein SAMN05445504_3153 [Burkholderia sp. CF099]
MKTTQRFSNARKRHDVDDSLEAVEARMRAFIERTRGWGITAGNTKLPDDIVVLAGPTRANPRRKGIK